MSAPTVLFNEDGHPSLVSVQAAPTARQATRIAFRNAYEDAIFDYCGTADINGDGSVYRPVLSEYAAFVNSLSRHWHCPSQGSDEWEGGLVWNRCKDIALPGAHEYWEVPQ